MHKLSQDINGSHAVYYLRVLVLGEVKAHSIAKKPVAAGPVLWKDSFSTFLEPHYGRLHSLLSIIFIEEFPSFSERLISHQLPALATQLQ